MKYSPSTCGFYIEDLHKDIPADAITLTQAEYESLYAGLSSGKQVVIEGGKAKMVPQIPVAASRLDQIYAELKKIDLDSIRWLREKNDAELKKLDDKYKALIVELAALKK